MTREEYKDLVENFIDDVWNNHNLDNLDEFLADDYIEHNGFGEFRGVDEFQGFVAMNLRSFPDFSVTVDEIIGEGELVACTYTTEGTHQEDFLGAEATHNTLQIDGCYMCRIEDGTIAEGWNQFDVLAIMIGLELIRPDMLGDLPEKGTTIEPGTRV